MQVAASGGRGGGSSGGGGGGGGGERRRKVGGRSGSPHLSVGRVDGGSSVQRWRQLARPRKAVGNAWGWQADLWRAG